MDYTKLFEYQEKDNQLAQLNNEYFSSEAYKANKQSKATIEESKKKIDALENASMQILSGYADIKNKIEEIAQELDEFLNIVDNTESVKDADYYMKKILELEASLQALERQNSQDNQNIDKINLDYNRYIDGCNKATEIFKRTSVEVDRLKAEIMSKGAPIQQEMKELEKQIDPELLNEYKSIKKSGVVKKFPIYVSTPKNETYCIKCGMELSVEAKNALKISGNRAECQTCRSILIAE